MVRAEHKAHWSITSHCYIFIMIENTNKTNPCVNVSNGNVSGQYQSLNAAIVFLLCVDKVLQELTNQSSH